MKTEDVVKYFGTKVAVAKALGIKKQAISQWGELVPIGRAYQLHVITKGKLKATGKAA
jgi:hypothetical protein